MVFVVERQTMKFLPMKQYHIVLECGLVYCNDEHFSTKFPKMYCSQKFHKNTTILYMTLPPARYTHIYLNMRVHS